MTLLQLDRISKSFGALAASTDISLTVLSGEIHALIGPNGAGKTTLIQQIYGALTPDTGTISLNGEDITSLSVPARVRKGIGRSFQISNVLMQFSVLENAIIAEQARQGNSFNMFWPAFEDASVRAGAEAILDRLGLLPRAYQQTSALAHGERRMLELALALAVSPSLLLLDEPMAGAGIDESQHITQIIDQLRGKMGILLIEHDMDAVFKLADRISVLVEGRIIAVGTPDEISQNHEVKTAYLGEDS